MLKTIFNVSIAIMSIFATNVFANDECKSEVEVTGTIETTNVSQSIQVGTIHLQLTNEKGRMVFDERGGIIGSITSQSLDETTGFPISILNHQIIFAAGRIETIGDIAEIDYALTECSFHVTETISNLWGTRFFKRASGDITAEGIISFCEGANGNNFELSGTVCLK